MPQGGAGSGVIVQREEWVLNTGCEVEFAVAAAGWVSSPRRHSAHWGELVPPQLRKQEGASNLLNLCIDKLSS